MVQQRHISELYTFVKDVRYFFSEADDSFQVDGGIFPLFFVLFTM